MMWYQEKVQKGIKPYPEWVVFSETLPSWTELIINTMMFLKQLDLKLPPFPKGYEVEERDILLLESVYYLGKIYRD